MPGIARSDPGHVTPAPSAAQNVPNEVSSNPTTNLSRFSGTRVRGSCTTNPTATTRTTAMVAPSAARGTWCAVAPKVTTMKITTHDSAKKNAMINNDGASTSFRS